MKIFFLLLALYGCQCINIPLLESSGSPNQSYDYMTFGVFNENTDSTMFLFNKSMNDYVTILKPPTPYVISNSTFFPNLIGNCSSHTKSNFVKNSQNELVLSNVLSDNVSELVVLEYDTSFNILAKSMPINNIFVSLVYNNTILLGLEDNGNYVFFENKNNVLVPTKYGNFSFIKENILWMDVEIVFNYTVLLGRDDNKIYLFVLKNMTELIYSEELHFTDITRCSLKLVDFFNSGVKSIIVNCGNSINIYLVDNIHDEIYLEQQFDLDKNRKWKIIETGKWIDVADGEQLIVLREKNDSSLFDVRLLVYGDSEYYDLRKFTLSKTFMQQEFSEVEKMMPNKINITQIVNWLNETHTNTFGFPVCDQENENIQNYDGLVRFLDETKDVFIDGNKLRVWIGLDPPSEAIADACRIPTNSPLTSFNETELFDGNKYWDQNGYSAWGKVIGLLARQYSHLVALNIDDLTHDISGEYNTFTPHVIASITANMRKYSPHLSLAPTMYYSQNGIFIWDLWPDMSLTLDGPLFFFRNEKEGAGPCSKSYCIWGPLVPPHPKSGGCLAGSCADETVYNVLDEIKDILKGLPDERRIIVGVYASQHSSLGEPSAKYVRDILPIIFTEPRVDGISIWTMFVPQTGGECSNQNLTDKGCIISDFFGEIAL